MLKFAQRFVMYSVSVVIIQGPKKSNAANTPTILGMNVSVCSWMDVTVWKMLTSRPIDKETRSNGNDVISNV